MIEIQVRLFGALRKYEGSQPSVRVEAPAGVTVAAVKERLASQLRAAHAPFKDEQLIQDSAIANETQVLQSSTVIERSCTLAILPPVCGG